MASDEISPNPTEANLNVAWRYLDQNKGNLGDAIENFFNDLPRQGQPAPTSGLAEASSSKAVSAAAASGEDGGGSLVDAARLVEAKRIVDETMGVIRDEARKHLQEADERASRRMASNPGPSDTWSTAPILPAPQHWSYKHTSLDRDSEEYLFSRAFEAEEEKRKADREAKLKADLEVVTVGGALQLIDISSMDENTRLKGVSSDHLVKSDAPGRSSPPTPSESGSDWEFLDVQSKDLHGQSAEEPPLKAMNGDENSDKYAEGEDIATADLSDSASTTSELSLEGSEPFDAGLDDQPPTAQTSPSPRVPADLAHLSPPPPLPKHDPQTSTPRHTFHIDFLRKNWDAAGLVPGLWHPNGRLPTLPPIVMTHARCEPWVPLNPLDQGPMHGAVLHLAAKQWPAVEGEVAVFVETERKVYSYHGHYRHTRLVYDALDRKAIEAQVPEHVLRFWTWKVWAYRDVRDDFRYKLAKYFGLGGVTVGSEWARAQVRERIGCLTEEQVREAFLSDTTDAPLGLKLRWICLEFVRYDNDLPIMLHNQRMSGD